MRLKNMNDALREYQKIVLVCTFV